MHRDNNTTALNSGDDKGDPSWRYKELIRLGQLLNSDFGSVEQLFKHLRDCVRELFDTRDFFMLVLHQMETNSLDVFFTDRTGDHVKRGQPFDGASALVIERREPKLIAHRSQDSELPFALVDLSPEPSVEESLLFVPLLFRDSCLGVLSVQHREPNFFDQNDLDILQLLANQVALALNTMRLFDNLSEIHATGQALLRTLDVEPSEIAQTIVEQVRRASGADIVVLYPAPGGRPAPRPAVSGTLQEPNHPRSDPPRQDDIVLLTLQGERPLYGESSTLFERLGGHSELRQGNFAQRERVLSTAALPLRVGDELVGALFVNYRSPQRFGAAQRRLLESLASYAAVSLRNAGAFDAINAQRIGELQALQAIGHTLAQSLDLPTVLDRILDFARERSKADSAAIVLYDEGSGNLVCQAAKGDLAAERIGLTIDPQSPKSIVSWVFREGLSACVNDVHAEHPWARYYDEVDPPVRAELDVPLRDADRQVVGVIILESRTPNAFGLDEKDFVETLAGQAVLAIRNAQAYERERRLADERAALIAISKEIVGQLDPTQVFQRILNQALKLTNTTVGTLHLYDPVADRLYLVAEQGLAEQHRQAALEKVHLPYIPGMRAELAVPLMEGARLRGVLNLASFTPGHFTERDERLVVAFADLALIALQNAERFQEAQNQRQRAERETERVALLYEAGRRLTATTDEQAAYEVVGQIAHEHFAARVAIHRVQPDKQLLVPALDIGGDPAHPARTLTLDEGLNGQVARERRTIVIADTWNTPPGVTPFTPSDPRDRSVLATPIGLAGLRIYGTMGMSHRSANYFDGSDIQLLEGLAQQLALTIERVETVSLQRKLEVEMRSREAEMMTYFGQNIAALTHDLGNDLGPIATMLRQIRRELEANDFNSPFVYQRLEEVTQDVSRVVQRGKMLKRELRETTQDVYQQRTKHTIKSLIAQALILSRIPKRISVRDDTIDSALSVECDAEEIIAILRCLITNASQAIPKRGLICLRAQRDLGQVWIEVSDNGPGISMALQKRIFELGFSTKSSSGFGLWSARRNALRNGGELQVFSQPGNGATFRLTLREPSL